MEFKEPWFAVANQVDRTPFELELATELPDAHVLAGKTSRLIARRRDRDDCLFELGQDGWAIVHLTWGRQRETDPQWPRTHLLHSVESVAERIERDAQTAAATTDASKPPTSRP